MAKVKSVSVGGDRTVWCVDVNGRLYKWDGGQWRRNPTAIAEEVAVGRAGNLWCRNSLGELFVATGSGWDTGWQRLSEYPGNELRSISANIDGELWLVNGQREVWRWRNNLWTTPGSARDGQLVSSGSSSRVCYVNQAGALKLSGVDVSGLTWATVRKPVLNGVEVTLRSVSYSVEGSIWATDTGDNIYKRGRTDRVWRRNENGQAVQVAVGPTNEVWVVNRAGEIFRASHSLGFVNTYWHPYPEPGSTTFTARPGDTVFSIVNHVYPGLPAADRERIVAEIVRVNGLRRYTTSAGVDVIVIEVGQVLQIPPR